MSARFIKFKKVSFTLMTIGIIASQLMGCGAASSKEFIDAVNNRQAIEVVLEVPEGIEQGETKEMEWVQLDQLDTYETFRRSFDDALGITNYGEDSKNGIAYVDLEGNQCGNNTLYNGFANNKFRENYWENDAVQLQVQNDVLKQFADVDAETDDSKMAALNAYYNIFADAEPNYFNGSSLITRGEFMAGVFKAETPVGTLEEDKSFSALVGGGEYADYAFALANDSYLDINSKSLNSKTFNGMMTRGEAVFMLVSHYYSKDLSNASGASNAVDVKNGGDIASKQKFDGDYSKSYELVYAVENADKGAPEDIYKALEVAYNKGILLSGEASRWDEAITKTEALELITNTYMSMPTVHGLAKGKGDGTAIIEAAEDFPSVDLTDLYAHAVVETESEEEEEYIQSLEEGEELKNLEVEDMESNMYAIQNVNLRKGTYVTTEALRLVGYGEQVKVTGITVDKQWYRVEDKDKGEGFIASSYLSAEKPAQNQSTIQTASSDTKESSDSNGDTVDSQSTQKTSGGFDINMLSPEEQAVFNQITAGSDKGPAVQTGQINYNAQATPGLHLNK